MRNFHRRVSDLVKFQVERFLIGGPLYLLTFVSLLIILVSVGAGGLVWLLDSQAASLWESIWWAFLRLSDPGYLGDDKGASRMTISTVVTILGYVLFMGALVAVLTQWLQHTIRQLESGLTPVRKKNHIVVLGWTNRTPAIVHNLLSAGKRLDRFLQLIGKSSLSIVILTKEVSPELAQNLKDELGPKWNKRQIIFRTGDPLKIFDLQRVDLWNASVAILSSSTFSPGGLEVADSRTIKTLLSIANEARLHQQNLPTVIAEIFDHRKSSLAKDAYHGRLEIVSTHLLVSRLICQFIRNPGVSLVYEEMLSEEGNNSVYVRNADQQSGVSWGSIERGFEKAIPIGLINADRQTTLCPKKDVQIQSDDKIIFISKSVLDTQIGQATETQALDEGTELVRQKNRRSLLILGWASKIPRLVEELGAFEGESVQMDIVSQVSQGERQSILEKYRRKKSDISITHLVLDYSVPTEIESLDFNKYDNVIILASDWLPSIEDADAKSVLGYLLVKKRIAKLASPPPILLELFDADNLSVFDRSQGDVIVSPAVVSHMLANTALRPDLNPVFSELCDSSELSISFRPPEAFSIVPNDTFDVVQQKVSSTGQIALGFVREKREGNRLLHLNPTRSIPMGFSPIDRLIVLGHY